MRQACHPCTVCMHLQQPDTRHHNTNNPAWGAAHDHDTGPSANDTSWTNETKWGWGAIGQEMHEDMSDTPAGYMITRGGGDPRHYTPADNKLPHNPWSYRHASEQRCAGAGRLLHLLLLLVASHCSSHFKNTQSRVEIHLPVQASAYQGLHTEMNLHPSTGRSQLQKLLLAARGTPDTSHCPIPPPPHPCTPTPTHLLG